MKRLLTSIVLALSLIPTDLRAGNKKDLKDTITVAQIAKDCGDKKEEGRNISYVTKIKDGSYTFHFKYLDVSNGKKKPDNLIGNGDYLNLFVEKLEGGYSSELRTLKFERGKVAVYVNDFGSNISSGGEYDSTMNLIRRIVELDSNVKDGYCIE